MKIVKKFPGEHALYVSRNIFVPLILHQIDPQRKKVRVKTLGENLPRPAKELSG